MFLVASVFRSIYPEFTVIYIAGCMMDFRMYDTLMVKMRFPTQTTKSSFSDSRG